MLTAFIYIYTCPIYLVAENTKQELGKENKNAIAKIVFRQSCHRISITTHREMI
jgi:hypothetical protein